MNTIEQVIQNTSVCVCVCVLDDFAEETDIHTHKKKLSILQCLLKSLETYFVPIE